MDTEGFRELLQQRHLSVEKIPAALALAERFEAYSQSAGIPPGTLTTRLFCHLLMEEGGNTFDNFITLARYGWFIRNNEIYIAVLELLDGAEVQPNLYQKVGEAFGDSLRNEVFDGIGVAALGIPSTEKPGYMFPVLERLIAKVGYPVVEGLLSPCLRDLPDEYYQDEIQRYQQARDIDEYLVQRHAGFVDEMRRCQQAARPFFTQEVSDEVLAYVAADQEIESGVRQGNTLYVSKIPYNTMAYLHECDPLTKRYHACHCPWAREAILNE